MFFNSLSTVVLCFGVLSTVSGRTDSGHLNPRDIAAESFAEDVLHMIYARDLYARAPAGGSPSRPVSPYDRKAGDAANYNKVKGLYEMGEQRPENQGRDKSMWSKVKMEDAAKQSDKLGAKTLEQNMPSSQISKSE